MKKYIIGIFFIVLLVLLVSANSEIKISKSDNKVSEALAKDGKVKVIVVMNDSVQKGVSSLDETKIKNRFSSFNGFSAELTAEDIAKLESNPNVKKIFYDRVMQASLYNSTIIINATLTWPTQINGVNLTGIGETICIIDTGVNYSHADLGGCFGSGCKVMGGWDFVNNDNDPMDDHGHGTHVAGIIAANGTITGVAPGAKIIAIKVLNSAGSGSDSNILAGIDWCVGNASVYNISIISMSLGIDCGTYPEYCYTSYCDSIPIESSYKTAINAATAKNISVIAASGNNGIYNMSSPACIQNATPVGATTKLDAIASYSNRNVIVQLFAPGSTINSTSITGRYESNSGTSMATPHVAGAFAIINQYLKLAGKTKTPQEIESTLNSTGALLDDTAGSGFYFSRINIYSAILSLINPIPYFTSIPTATTLNYKTDFNVDFNATDETSFDSFASNDSRFSINSTGGLKNLVNLSVGVYNINITINDSSNNKNTTIYVVTINKALTNSTLYVNNTHANFSAYNNTATGLNNIWLNGTLNETGNLLIYLNGSLINNNTAPVSNSTNLTIGYYNLTLNYSGNENYSASDDILWINITKSIEDIVPPYFLTNANQTLYNNASLAYQVNATDNLGISGYAVNETATFSINSSGYLKNISALSIKIYNLNITINDTSNNKNSTILVINVTDIPAAIVPPVSGSSSGGGGGGGGGSSSTTTVNVTTNTTANITINQPQSITAQENKTENITTTEKIETKNKITFATIKGEYQKIMGRKNIWIIGSLLLIVVVFSIVKKYKGRKHYNKRH